MSKIDTSFEICDFETKLGGDRDTLCKVYKINAFLLRLFPPILNIALQSKLSVNISLSLYQYSSLNI